MITSIIYDRLIDEAESLKDIMRDIAARLTDERWDICSTQKTALLQELLAEKQFLDMLLFDVDDASDVETLKSIRSDYRLAYIMLIADSGISPMKYLNPHIQAQSLLLRPFSLHQANVVLGEFLSQYVETNLEKEQVDDCFSVDLKDDGRINIPYNMIYFFEALEKKVYVCAGVNEYGFYETLDSLEEKLPQNFKRCHRSFIVNTDKICRIAISKSTIYLQDDLEVPLSRSFKPDFKGLRSVSLYGQSI